jgi:pimeloyl-CoA dehydrogenase large subunit
MNLSFTSEQLAFRDEVRAFVADALPSELRRRLAEDRPLSRDQYVEWQRILNRKGWAVPHWPVRFGGTGWDAVRLHIWSDELQQAPAPAPLAFNVDMVGPVIAHFGSEAQQQRFLPRAANLDDWWCQGFSEPGAGSDLAALRTTARRDGEHYLVNGQKIWTTLAQYADWIFCLVRTDPNAKAQRGISFLLIDLRSPGVSVRPIVTIDGAHEINEVFLNDVAVPVENLVGEENRGWDYAKFLLGRERTGIARVGTSKLRLRRIRELASVAQPDGRVPLADAGFAQRLTALEVELKALEITQLRVLAAQNGGHDSDAKPDPASSILKLKGSQIQQAATELVLELAGPHALRYDPAVVDPDRAPDPAFGEPWIARAAPTYFNWRKTSIYGGSNEIQRNIIAKAILGL